jgi:hypothetical protein
LANELEKSPSKPPAADEIGTMAARQIAARADRFLESARKKFAGIVSQSVLVFRFL